MTDANTRFDHFRFFLWGYLKSIIFKTQPENLDDLDNELSMRIKNKLKKNYYQLCIVHTYTLELNGT